MFSRRSSGGGCYALMVMPLVFPVMAVTSYLGKDAREEGTMVVVGIHVVALLLWQVVRAEYRLELGDDRVRFVERLSWLGLSRPETVMFDVPLDATSRVKQVNTRTPSSRGGWNHGSAIHFPGDKHAVSDYFLGSREDPKSEYNRLVAALRARFGDRFTVEDKV